ncbi:MAG TPA: hypothetical protein VEF05_09390 [Terriglobales bacterium]|nr:hypothetical protein [Terriglobales bacterium]
MLSKCANPNCSTPFHYLRDGKLFRWDGVGIVRHPAAPSQAPKPNRKVEFFWLCGKCATRMIVVFQEGVGVTVRPLVRSHKAAS